MMPEYHQSVMFNESMYALNIKTDGIYIDATFGRGGHAQGILNRLSKKGRLIAFDQDINAIEYANKNLVDNRLTLIHSAFSKMLSIITKQGLIGRIDGILIDLGVSSPQLENAQRGFSFRVDGPLDMRMNQTTGMSATQWLKSANEEEIANVIYQFSNEKKSRHIANKIKKYQKNHVLETTLELANIVSKVVKKQKNKHPATRTFQAIRIFINQELKQLISVLEQSKDILSKNGRLSIISFHSIEDRIVKRFIQKNSRQKTLPKGLPIIENEIEKTYLKDLGKYLTSKAEIDNNKRARSAILRVASKN
ncbi:16S rRNA (cytosine(1402)-N(4))-methyltransferase RsmH [Candidatus Vesicomyidisocius calyptogenae]|uniref:Ribosomal RNA small subunit methyltransferase H n=1 Tax=Vesicomyosocius okutanii subsp. Calyptogena okutanii (strain HA) TaxID=412965 RepID=RSMH_VESOH|nr:16S rRNA (cytosine(1402)-N(4))-methyltransferase RsmH [Candidatus Vesicomyosocius okutanii]A5CX97.1 RecName: Full=Ribosomal RNA small subunit methyltransferase H; AltName: Full=16S rRNA m(4)C1402 methyltransferase; AltName: Full=rRNA (cytosine-N(4)-)-methyltransferase RsmH [Candidatus Vesicomyosocius okutanii]BAF61411.1 S-adenosyl-methyltransferase [Candidatus Vesicomyosocius okutanii]